MAYQNTEPFSKKLTIVVGLTVVGIMAFGLAVSFYKNVLFDKTLEDIRKENAGLQDEIRGGYRDLEYFKSAQYKDKYAKENLGLVNPDEHALIIAEKQEDPVIQEMALTPTDQQEAAYEELLRQMPAFEHWNLFLFHRDRIDDIKKGL